MTDGRFHQTPRQVLLSVSGKVRAHQTARQVLLTPNVSVKFNQTARQVLLSQPNISMRLHQTVRMVLLTQAAAHPIVYAYALARQVLIKSVGAVRSHQLVRMVLCGTTAPPVVSDNPGFCSILW